MSAFLIADDSHEKTAFLRALLEREGFDLEIVTAETTEEAVKLLASHPDIVAGFVDYQMPEQNGPWLIRAWRELEKKEGRTRAWIALATAEGGVGLDHFGIEAMAAGADAVASTKIAEQARGTYVEDALKSLRRYLEAERV